MDTVKIETYQWNRHSNGYRHVRRRVRDARLIGNVQVRGCTLYDWQGEITFYNYPRTVYGVSTKAGRRPDYWTDSKPARPAGYF